MKTGVSNRVPPLMVKTSYLWTTSDPTYASVNGEDLLPDLAIGRLPAATVDEARAMVEKIVAYETGDVSLDGPAVLIARSRFPWRNARSARTRVNRVVSLHQ